MHRSGRTGRAGRKGVCVTLYSNRDRGMLQQIEQKTGNTLEWTGAPSPKSLLAASSQTAIDDAAAVDDANPNPHPIPIPNPTPNPNPNQVAQRAGAADPLAEATGPLAQLGQLAQRLGAAEEALAH